MENKILGVAIHELSRGSDGFILAHGKINLAVTETIQRVNDEIYALYRRRTSKSHGKFSIADDYSPTPKQIRDYVEGGYQGFYALTKKMGETLRIEASKRNSAHGGYIFFSHFVRENNHFLLVVIINDKLGAAMTGDYDVADSPHLDIDGFRFAGRINLTSWAAHEERYIGFLKGKGNVSDYFKNFLGCDTAVQDRIDTSNLVKALQHYAADQEITAEEKDHFLAKAKSIFERHAKANQEVSFQSLANELVPDEPEKLLDRLTDPELKLNDQFVPDRRALGPLIKYKGRTASWTVEFPRAALTEGKVQFDPADNTLILSNVPPELAREISDALEKNDED